MTIANQTGLIGAGDDYASTTPLFPLGTVSLFGNNSYTYVQAAASQANAATFGLTGGFATTTGTTFTNATGSTVPANSYFWAKRVASPFA